MPMPEQGTVHIDTAAIPAMRAEDLARGALSLVEQAFLMPGAEERYQQWLSERNRRKE